MHGKVLTQATKFAYQDYSSIFFIFEEDIKSNKKLKLDSNLLTRLKTKIELHQFEGKEDQQMTIENSNGKYYLFIGVGKAQNFNLVKFKNFLATALKTASSLKIQTVQVEYFEKLGNDFFEIGKSLSISLYLSNYRFNKYKEEKEKQKAHNISELYFHYQGNTSEKLQNGIDYGKLISGGVYLTRDLVNEPSSHQSPESLVNEALNISKDSSGKITVKVLEKDECKKLSMGAFLGVAKGSDVEPKFIILKYSACKDKKKKRKICLIGKSIIFDSGGLSLKPSESMTTMKLDMAGGATVLGVFKILSKLASSDLEIYGILPACENMPSGKALKPGDIVTALNGKTIEVLNIDAEGRLILCDALAYSEKHIKPDLTIDIATLTGACMVALGLSLTGMFSNNEDIAKKFSKVSEKEGDELWKLPLYKPYLKQLKSDIADMKNVGNGRYGGAIIAALFLSEFIKSNWIHLDIAGSAFNDTEDTGIIGKGGTGWGIASLIEFIKTY